MTIWDTLSDLLTDRAVERPTDSVTPDELAQKASISHSRAAAILREDKRLKAVKYKTEAGKRGVCYVVQQ